MFTGLVNKVQGLKNVAYLKFRRVRPEVALVVGGISVLAGTVLACTKTKEAVDTVENAKNELREIKKRVEEEHSEGTPETIQEYTAAYGRLAWKLTKIYIVPAGLWIGGMASITSGHIDLRHQNTNLLLDSVAFRQIVEEYRGRVREEVGEEKEKQLYFGAKEDDIEVVETNPKTGASKIVKKKATVLSDSNGGSKFARNFSPQTSVEYDARSYASFFLEARIKELNRQLKREDCPFITINEVYDVFGMKKGFGKCKEGMHWGWTWMPDRPDAPNEIVIERLDGWEQVFNERENKYVWTPCLRIDFNCQDLDLWL